jgi:hypothetical protein
LIEGRLFNLGEDLNWRTENLNINSVSKNRVAPYAPIRISFQERINWYDYSEFKNIKSGFFRFFCNRCK